MSFSFKACRDVKGSGIEKDITFYKSVFALAVPLMLQSTLQYSVTTVDSIMLGSLSEVAMSRANIANQPFNIVSGLVRGLGVGSGILIAQYWGKRDIKTIEKVIPIATKIALALSRMFAIITFLIPQQIMSVFTNETEIAAAGVFYLRIISVTFILYSISMTYMTAVRSMEDARTPLVINIITYAVNILLNYCFLFGKFGLPAMGINGVAIGTLIARIVELICCLFHITRFNKTIHFDFASFKTKDQYLTSSMVKYGTPNMMAEMVYTIGMSMYAVIFGHLGAVATHANTVATMAARIGDVLLYGVAGTSAVLIGKTLGEGNRKKVWQRSNSYIMLSVIFAVIASVITYFLKGFILGLYSLSPETYRMADKLLNVIVFYQIGYTFECLFVTGILVAGGDTKFIFLYTTRVMWLITIPCASLFAFVLNAPVVMVFFVLKLDYFIKGAIGMIRYRSGKWINDVTNL